MKEKNEVVLINIVMIIAIALIIWGPLLFGIQIDIIPMILYILTYYRRKDFIQAMLNGMIIGLAAVKTPSFLILLAVCIVTVVVQFQLIEMFKNVKISIHIRASLIVLISTIINGILYTFMKYTSPDPTFLFLLVIVKPLMNAVLMFICSSIWGKVNKYF